MLSAQLAYVLLVIHIDAYYLRKLHCRNALLAPLRMSVALIDPFVMLVHLFSFHIVPYMLPFEVSLNFLSSYFFVQKFSCLRYLTLFLIIYDDLEIVIDSLLVFMDICCLDLWYMISPVNFILQFGRMSSLTSFNFYQVVLLRLHVHTGAFLTDITCQTVIQHLKNWYTLLVDRGCSVSFC